MYEIQPGPFTTDEILDKVSQEEIWEYYLGFEVEVGTLFLSPLRDESKPSANLFYTDDGTLLLKDFGYATVNIWQFVQHRFGITFQEAIQKIGLDLCLDLRVKLDRPSTRTVPKSRDRTSIQIKIKRWNKDFYRFWEEFHISKETLKLYRVIPISALWINNTQIGIKLPAYSYEFGKAYRKIYSPFDNKLRFISNVPGEIYSGYEQLPWFDNQLIITKSHKDVMVWHELGYHAISPQGEGHSISKDFVHMLSKRFKNIILNYDNDEAGRRYTEKLTTLYGFTPLFIPEFKDISDYIRNFGKEQTALNVKEWLNNIK